MSKPTPDIGELTIDASSVTAAFLWPIGATLELAAGSYFYPIAAIAAAYVAGGMVPFWRASFPAFVRGYAAGGAVYGLSVYSRTDKYAKNAGNLAKALGVFAAAGVSS